ncbi:Transcriptional regulator, AraC-family [Cupriavidus necator]|uniref:AraC family transcriptional regulator n=1 Tax=Cupriavidus necator (strain ATCC 17699 / DSM 428 / KCTC 22496 / NCIMB 10442 / H16 / Stanier 337) TaxID=381666 RepID=Q0KB15_CUPNH|nr:helix-turn-helix transcriptional regulator [Cupriavidus necator]QCC00668.1 AraC family transcriptional regulator [Cupriavidus necator H16]QQB76505.1 helix-turn-helix transcriptional regulator [Cupriavidus necator]WKA42542.1 helix-turn-helix transcriptional regulator [Cupriavidus necator]CAJ92806.1 transcriptional regulator, AraC-family [Cupriavidus necator H16]
MIPLLAASLFRCQVRYDETWAGLEFPVAYLDQPLKTGNPQVFLEAVKLCKEQFGKLNRQQTLTARVRRLMLEKEGGFPTLLATARHLNMTPRTLHRKLMEEGASYREILDDIRRRLAIVHLKANRLTIQEIAFTLGFSDLANFRRAFRRWEGMAPSDYQRQVPGIAATPSEHRRP